MTSDFEPQRRKAQGWGVVKSLAGFGCGPVGLVHRQKVRFFQKKNPTCFALSISGFDPTVWTGRALQAGCEQMEGVVLRICIRPLHGAFVLLAIMDIRAHPISFSERP